MAARCCFLAAFVGGTATALFRGGRLALAISRVLIRRPDDPPLNQSTANRASECLWTHRFAGSIMCPRALRWTWQAGCVALVSNNASPAFRENSITEKVLPHLTADDLKELGVSTVGDRRLFLDAIADLRFGTKKEAITSEASATVASPAKAAADERRRS
jgi:hypothetical protein